MTETLPSPTATVSPRKRLFTAIKWTVCIATVICVSYALWKNLRDFDWRNFHPNLFFILAAVLSIVGVTITQIIAYRLLLAAHGLKLTWRQAATLSWVPGLAKYVPGKVVAIGSTVYLLRKYQISAAIALSVALMGDAVAVLTGLIACAPMLITPEVREHLPGGWIWCALLIFAGLVCLYPPVFAKLVNIALRKLKRPELKRDSQASILSAAGSGGVCAVDLLGKGALVLSRVRLDMSR